MEGQDAAVERVTAWITRYEQSGLPLYGDRLGSSYEGVPLLLSDIKALLPADGTQ